MSEGDCYTELMKAVEEGNPDEIKKIIDSGVDVNAQNSDGWTALMRACEEGNIKCIKLLLAAGADPNIQSNNGNTALMWACYYGYPQVCYFVISARRGRKYTK